MAAATLCAGLGLLGCGGPSSIALQIESEAIVADGMQVVAIRADVVDEGRPAAGSRRVTFTASQPLLFVDTAAAMPPQPGALAAGDSTLAVHPSGGVARVFLRAPVAATTLTLTAAFTDTNRAEQSDRLTLMVQPPPLVSAGRLAAPNCETALSDLEQGFAFACALQNVGAWVTPRDPIAVSCSVRARDRHGTTLHHAPVQFATEAGTLRWTPASNRDPRQAVYGVPQAIAGWPRDVAPSAAEQQHGLVGPPSGLIPGALSANPRDGLVTLLAVTWGEEAFFDGNNNGRYDPGEFFCDEGEPFVDVDDDGVFNPAAGDGPFWDSDGDGVWDGANGRWDGAGARASGSEATAGTADRRAGGVWLGRLTHILWSGPVDPERSAVLLRGRDADVSRGLSGGASGRTVPAGEAASFALMLVDAHDNPVAAVASKDEIRLEIEPRRSVGLSVQAVLPGGLGGDGGSSGSGSGSSGNGVLARSATVALTNTHGLRLQSRWPLFRFGMAAGGPYQGIHQDAAGLLQGRAWPLWVGDRRDGAALEAACGEGGGAWALSTQVRHTPATNHPDGRFAQLRDTFEVAGRLLAVEQGAGGVATCDQ